VSAVDRATAAADARPAARAALEAGAAALERMRDPEGFWWGELESNASMTAEHVFLTSLLGVARPADLEAMRAELLASRNAEGGWSIWFGGPSDLSITVEAYYALKLCGLDPAAPEMRRAREIALDLGGVNRSRFFTRLWLAVLGRYPWSLLPALPPEMIFLPPRAPLSPYRFACWARGTFVALMVVMSVRPRYLQPLGLDELFREPPGVNGPITVRTPGRWTPWLARGERVARLYARRPLPGPRRRAYARIARWITERQEADGSWGGIQPPWVYSLIALHCLGYPLDHPVMARGLRGFDERFRVEDGDRLRVQACLSPVWDTALAAIALQEAGRDPRGPAVGGAIDWLLGREVRRFGDWHIVPRRGRPGGWSFEFENQWYPDTDDTAEVLIALRRAGLPPSHPAVRRGVEWLLAMESAGGGWASFDVDNDMRLMTQLPVCDFGEVIDPPTEDVTGHVVEALVECGVPASHPAVRRGVAYLRREQRPDGGSGPPARGRLARRLPESGRRLGRERGLVPQPGVGRAGRLDRVADGVGAHGTAGRRPRPSRRRPGRRVPGGDAADRRHLG
jgi:squalene-hopene/tetraprenyl-beta-curcumene cyclase